MASTGKIKFFNKTKMYGFIINDGQENELFVHIKDCKKGYMPDKEDRVEFDIEETDKGMAAKNVTKIQ